MPSSDFGKSGVLNSKYFFWRYYSQIQIFDRILLKQIFWIHIVINAWFGHFTKQKHKCESVTEVFWNCDTVLKCWYEFWQNLKTPSFSQIINETDNFLLAVCYYSNVVLNIKFSTGHHNQSYNMEYFWVIYGKEQQFYFLETILLKWSILKGFYAYAIY